MVASEYADSGLTNSTTYYYYTVTAVDSAGNQSADSAETSATPAHPQPRRRPRLPGSAPWLGMGR